MKKSISFYSFQKNSYPNLGIAYVSALLKERNLVSEVTFTDACPDLSEVVEELTAVRPDIVGLSATSCDFDRVLELSRLLKESFRPLILLGGAHITSVCETLPETVDIGLIGEGEETACELLEAANRNDLAESTLEKISGITFRSGDGTQVLTARREFIKNLDNIPFPDRDLFPSDYWTGPTSLITSRGCPYNCAFCQVSAQRRICRYHSAERVVSEIEQVVEKQGVKVFDIVDDLFVANRRRIPEITAELRSRGLLGSVRFALNGRANLINDRVVEMCADLGAFVVTLGLESMSEPILGLLKDRSSVESNRKAVDTIHAGGLKAGGLFMLGTPGEGLEDMLETLGYVVENRDKFGGVGGMVLCVTSPLPTTRLWDLCVEQGRIDPDLSKCDWRKLRLAVSPERLDENIYVGDLEPELFKEVFAIFHRVFYDRSCIESYESRLRELNRFRALMTRTGEVPARPGTLECENLAHPE